MKVWHFVFWFVWKKINKKYFSHLTTVWTTPPPFRKVARFLVEFGRYSKTCWANFCCLTHQYPLPHQVNKALQYMLWDGVPLLPQKLGQLNITDRLMDFPLSSVLGCAKSFHWEPGLWIWLASPWEQPADARESPSYAVLMRDFL